MARVLAGEPVIHTVDAREDDLYRSGNPQRRVLVDLAGARSSLAVTLLKEGVALGAIHIYRQEVRPFTDKQIALLQNFAAQAVVAMENARLLTETREALDQQTATAEVLQVINSSPGDLAPVFDAMLDRAMRLCGAIYGGLFVYDGEFFRAASLRGMPSPLAEFLRRPIPGGRGTATRRLIDGDAIVQVADFTAPEYGTTDAVRKIAQENDVRTVIWAALRKDDALLGYISMYRSEVLAFSDKQVALLRNFASQAVIAMENARLITETREALEQQTATSEVLGVINSSPGDLAPVFDALLEKAMHLCEAAFGILSTYNGNRFDQVAMRGVPSPLAAFLREPVHPEPGTGLGRLVDGEPFVHISDASADKAYRSGYPARRALVDLGGARSYLSVALRKDDVLLGVFTIFRQEIRPFSDKQIALLQNFAAQAVIAMENARLITETREALAQQTATAEVLGVINSSPGDIAPVFDAMLEKAMRLCEAAFGVMHTYDGNALHPAALRGLPPRFAEFASNPANQPGPGGATPRLMSGEPIVHVVDLKEEEAYRSADPYRRALVDIGGARTLLAVPLRKDGEFLGQIAVYRQEVRPYSEKQVALLENFAAQAVIAMENARLLRELRERTDDLQESLEYQTATSDVLKVISRSTFDLDTVLKTVAATAIRLCRADHAAIYRNEEGEYRFATGYAPSPEYEQRERTLTFHPGTGTIVGRAALERRTIQILDAWTDDLYEAKEDARIGNVHTLLGVPLLREGAPIGVIGLARKRVEAFTDKEIALVTTFADQAVIAIENARLITETREALDQQTATAEVLGVINSSPGNLAPVFDAMLEKAMRLCDAKLGFLSTYDGQLFDAVAMRGVPEAYASEYFAKPYMPAPGTTHDLIVRGEEVVHITDLTVDPLDSPRRRAVIEMLGTRTILGVALRREGELVGALHLYRQEVRPFADKQIALLQNFAAQAVIAIENARLITETREALEQQTATAEVLQVINSSPGDLKPVFQAIVEKALRLCEAGFGGMMTYDGELFHRVAVQDDAIYTELYDRPIRPEPGTTIERIVRGENVVHIPDLIDDEAYRSGSRLRRELVEVGGARSMISIALRKDDILMGALHVYRREPRPFSEKEIALLENFAAQAVIAMENARLITETRDARDDAEGALRDLKAAQANLIQAEKMASLGQLTAGIAHEIKNPLNFVNNFASLSVELLDELKETTAPALAALDKDKRADADDTMELLTGNLEKIAEHGKRADNIVKSMLEHSRGVSGERREVDLNQLVEEALNLAYHGARAQDQGFNITLERDYAESLRPIEVAPQEITRVFLNLFGNGFYAATKRARENGDRAFRPTLTVATRDLGDAVEVRVRDNGTGIAPEIKDKLFQPFFTTKPTGEGTGLGLSISYDIVTQQHGGTITVESEPGAYTEFTIRLLRQ